MIKALIVSALISFPAFAEDLKTELLAHEPSVPLTKLVPQFFDLTKDGHKYSVIRNSYLEFTAPVPLKAGPSEMFAVDANHSCGLQRNMIRSMKEYYDPAPTIVPAGSLLHFVGPIEKGRLPNGKGFVTVPVDSDEKNNPAKIVSVTCMISVVDAIPDDVTAELIEGSIPGHLLVKYQDSLTSLTPKTDIEKMMENSRKGPRD